MPSQNHVNITLSPELWNTSALRLPMKFFVAFLRQHYQQARDRNTKFTTKDLALEKTVPLSDRVFSVIDSSSPLSKGYMNIHSDLTFSPQSETESNQCRSFPAGGNPDLSELIFPDDILAPRTADLYLNICCRKNTMQD